MPDITPNLGIKKPLGNENVSRASFNENYDIIDANAAPISKAQMVKLTKDDGYALTPPGTDLNTLTISGFYYGGNLTNAPEGTVFHRITVMMSASTSGIQIAVSNGGNQYIRNMTGSVWGRWVLQLNDNAPTWVNATLLNGWVNSSGFTARYMKDGLGIVSIQAVVEAGSIGAAILNLPAGLRPTQNRHFLCPTVTVGQFVRIGVTTAGNVNVDNISSGSLTGYISIDIQFRAV